MEYEGTRNVVSLGDSKQAAIYFDRVLIIEPSEQFGMSGIAGTDADAYNLVFDRPGSEQEILRYNYEFQEYRKSLQLSGFSFKRDRESGNFINVTRKALLEGYIDNRTLENGVNVRQALRDFAARLGIEKYSVLLPEHPDSVDTAAGDSICLTLSNLSLVDTARTSWAQIHELRRDRSALHKLRKLKLFLHETYSGQDQAFIEDDLAQRLYDYENTCRDHGLETCTSLLSMLLDAEHLQNALTGGVVAALFGGPATGLGAAAVIELSQIALEYAERRHQFEKFRRDHELGFIVHARHELQA